MTNSRKMTWLVIALLCAMTLLACDLGGAASGGQQQPVGGQQPSGGQQQPPSGGQQQPPSGGQQPPPSGGQPLAAPSNLRVTSTTKTVARIAWDDKSNNETGFEIEIEGKQNPKTGANETQWEVSGLKCNEAYNFKVRAFNATGNSAWSNQVTAQTLACDAGGPGSVPAAPDDLILGTQTFNLSTFTLGVHDNADNEQGFYLYVSGTRRATIPANSGKGEMTIWLNQLLPGAFTCGQTYKFQVSAFNAAGESARSNEFTWTVKCQP